MSALIVTPHALSNQPPDDPAYGSEYAVFDTDLAPMGPEAAIQTSDSAAVVWVGADRPASEGQSRVHQRRRRYPGDAAIQLPENKESTKRLLEHGYFHVAGGGWMPSLAVTFEFRQRVRNPGHFITNVAKANGCVLVEVRKNLDEVDRSPLRPGEARRLPDGDSYVVIRSCRKQDLCTGTSHGARESEILAYGWSYLLSVQAQPHLIQGIPDNEEWEDYSTISTPDVGVQSGDSWTFDIANWDNAKALIVMYGLLMLAKDVRTDKDALFTPLTKGQSFKVAQALGWTGHPLATPDGFTSKAGEVQRLIKAVKHGSKPAAMSKEEWDAWLEREDLATPTPSTAEFTHLLYTNGVLRPHPEDVGVIQVRMNFAPRPVLDNGIAATKRHIPRDWDELGEDPTPAEAMTFITHHWVDPETRPGGYIENDSSGKPRYWSVRIGDEVLNRLAVVLQGKV